MDAGLYVHIPFCDARCAYCDFVTFTDRHSRIDSYLDALLTELSFYPRLHLTTLFIGGGTPTVLSPRQIERLMTGIKRLADTSALQEATVEANPESATAGVLNAFKEHGIDRLSFGLQATQNALLKEMGRLHSREKFIESFAAARALGFENVNVDLMFGLPGQTLAMWSETLREIIELGPEHVSAYALKVEASTPWGKSGVTVDGDLQADMYLAASDALQGAGYIHYEISNFSRPGRESRHNLRYWKNEDTIGIGISSASYVGGRRYRNGGSLERYIDDAQGGRPFAREVLVLDPDDRHREDLMLGLRLKEGVEAARLETAAIPQADRFLDRGFARVQNGRYALTPQGWLLSNQLFQDLV